MSASVLPARAGARRTALYAILSLCVAAPGCGREPTGVGEKVRRVHIAGVNLAFPPAYQEAYQQAGSTAGIVPIALVRVLIRSPYGRAAVDTSVSFGGADSLALPIGIPLDIWWPDEQEPFTLALAFVDTQGDTVFRGGPLTLRIGQGANAALGIVTVPVTYTGPGANATAIHISPRSLTVVSGSDFSFGAVAVDASGAVIPGTPIAWSSLNPEWAALSSPMKGEGRAVGTSGTARIVGRLLTGPADTVTIVVQPRPPTLTLISGGGQRAAAGARLPAPVAVRVTSSDGAGRAGIAVSFTAADGGTASPASAVTDSGGGAEAVWTLGPTPGAQTLVVSVPGATGSPLVVAATATKPDSVPDPDEPTQPDSQPRPPAGPRVATRLAFTQAPTAAAAGVRITPAITVAILDDSGDVVGDHAGAVNLALIGLAGGAAFSGGQVSQVTDGIATFGDVAITTIGTGFRFIASSGALRPDTSAAFAVTAGPAARIAIEQGNGQTAPVSTALATPLTAKVTDALGNPVSGVSVAFAVATGGGSVLAASAQTNSTGLASTTWTLGPTAGTQTVTGSATGLAGSPVTWSATATAVTSGSAHLTFIQGPTTTVVGRKMTPSIVVHVIRADGQHDDSYNGPITLSLSVNPTGATLSGGSATASSGSATFNDVSVNRVGNGYVIVASGAGVQSVTSGTFNILPSTASVSGPATSSARPRP